MTKKVNYKGKQAIMLEYRTGQDVSEFGDMYAIGPIAYVYDDKDVHVRIFYV